MNTGRRQYKQAACRLAEPAWLPDDMRSGCLELVDLSSDNPRKGHATALMHHICLEADASGKVLILSPKPFADGLTQEQLEKWYGRFGFLMIQTEPAKIMARQPQVRAARLALVH